MKRHSEPHASSPEPKRLQWQHPVSCQLCRARKLRCDRSKPCSNCTSRNKTCVYNDDGQGAAQDVTAQGVRGGGSESNMIQERKLADVHRRLERLENAVFASTSLDQSSPGSNWQESHRPIFHIEQQAPSHVDQFSEEDLDIQTEPHAASRLLERVLTTPNSLIAAEANKGSTLASAVPRKSFINLPVIGLIPSIPLLNTNLSFYLPPQDFAVEMFEHYTQNEGQLYHFLHNPSTRESLISIYHDIEHGQPPDEAALALHFAIFASTRYFYSQRLERGDNFARREAKTNCEVWSNACLSLLLKNGQSIIPSLNALQAILVIGHLFSNIDGYSSTFHFLYPACIGLARTLFIHLVDTDVNRQKRERTVTALIELEVKRRVWWHIACSDWIFANMIGPSGGTSYNIQPRHMKVDYPSNVDDENITASEDYNLPPTEATSMSYYIQRIKLGELFREIFDAIPAVIEAQNLDYGAILTLHDKLQVYHKSLPPFFQIDAASISSTSTLCTHRPYLIWQRSMINLNFHMAICRLHRPFLLLGAADPRYAFSRLTCVRSAQAILDLRRQMGSSDQSPGAISDVTQLYYVNHHVFMAAVILAIDICQSQDETHMEQRKEEILSTCRMLDKMQDSSMVARKGVQTGVKVLRRMVEKFRERVPDRGREQIRPLGSDGEVAKAKSALEQGNPTRHMEEIRTRIDQQSDPPSTMRNSESLDSANFEELWSEFFDLGNALESPDWGDLMMDLDFQSFSG